MNAQWIRQRRSVVAANAEFRERELIKLASLAASVAETLRGRGVEEPAAGLGAEAGLAAFRIAFERWVEDPLGRDLPGLIRESLDELTAVAAASRRSRPPRLTGEARGTSRPSLTAGAVRRGPIASTRSFRPSALRPPGRSYSRRHPTTQLAHRRRCPR